MTTRRTCCVCWSGRKYPCTTTAVVAVDVVKSAAAAAEAVAAAAGTSAAAGPLLCCRSDEDDGGAASGSGDRARSPKKKVGEATPPLPSLPPSLPPPPPNAHPPPLRGEPILDLNGERGRCAEEEEGPRSRSRLPLLLLSRLPRLLPTPLGPVVESSERRSMPPMGVDADAAAADVEALAAEGHSSGSRRKGGSQLPSSAAPSTASRVSAASHADGETSLRPPPSPLPSCAAAASSQ